MPQILTQFHPNQVKVPGAVVNPSETLTAPSSTTPADTRPTQGQMDQSAEPPSPGITVGAKAGIGVGCSLVGLSLLAGVVWIGFECVRAAEGAKRDEENKNGGGLQDARPPFELVGGNKGAGIPAQGGETCIR